MEDPFDGMKGRAAVAKGQMLDLTTLAKAIITVELQMENVDLCLDKDTTIKTLKVLKAGLLSHVVCLARLEEAQQQLCDLRVKELTTTNKGE